MAKMADTADKHVLYERAVQSVDAEIDFVDATFRALRKRRASRLREDFCGTGASSCEWVRRRSANTAVGLDLDAETLEWGRRRNVGRLRPAARGRVTLLEADVLDAGRTLPDGAGRPVDTGSMDCVLAMNFSWWLLTDRAVLKRYFQRVHASLVDDGVLFMDTYGGWEAFKEQTERRPINGGHKARAGFTYIWEQETYDPITNVKDCHISFKLRDGSVMRRAFSYRWRIYTIPEARDLLLEVGFRDVTVYWEGDDGKGGGDGRFVPAQHGDCCASYIAYIVAQK